MSCNEWEEGTITLPAAQAAWVRDVMKGAAERHRKQLYDAAQRFWTELPGPYRRDREKYRMAVRAFMWGNRPRAANEYQPPGLPDPKLPAWRGEPQGHTDRNSAYEDLETLLQGMTHRMVTETRETTPGHSYEYRSMVECKPRRVQQADVVALIGKIAGTKFRIQCGESSISFDKRVVVWSVPENNHAREHGRTHPLARVLFETLGSVRWTRGTGGDIVGNDEYNRDSRDEGGGGNYVLTRFGPEPTPRRRRPAGARR